MAEKSLPKLARDNEPEDHAITAATHGFNAEYQSYDFNAETGNFEPVTVRTLETQNQRGQNFEHEAASRQSGGDRKFGSALEQVVSIPGINA